MEQQIIEKTCTRCGESKPADLKHFPVGKKTNTLNSWCRECYRLQSKAWSAKSPEQKAATNKAWRERQGDAYNERRRDIARRMKLSDPDRRKEHARKYNERIKREALDHYGGCICQCCGETEILMLALDHIAGDGANHRRSLSGTTRSMGETAAVWARKNNWPPIFRVLCMNCNWARHWNDGTCPHETRRQELLAA